MSKILALDLGDQWVGSAISDLTRILARPYKTVAMVDTDQFIKDTLAQETISIIIVGYPRTMRGTESDQTKKIVAEKERLEKLFPEVSWILWDERLSSKRAEASAGIAKNKEERLKSHSRAAAFILDSYLTYLHMQAELTAN